MIGALLLVGAVAAAPVAPHASYAKLVTANGHGAWVFDDDRFVDGYPHLYQALDPHTWTPDVLHAAVFGLTDGRGTGGWLLERDGATNETGTGILRIPRPHPSLTVTEYAFAPMDLEGAAIVHVLHVRNDGDGAVAGLQAVLRHDLALGDGIRGTSPSAAAWDAVGTVATLHARAPGATDVACTGVEGAVHAGARIGGGCDRTASDLAPAFGWTLPTLAPGDETWVGAVVGIDADVDAWIAGRAPEAWLTDARAGWEAVHAESVPPAGMEDDEAAVYRQALAFLLMGQVREPGSPFGQIPASLPLSAPVGNFQHVWNITWVRDASYAAAALARAGFAQRAVDALAFLARPGATGDWTAYVGGPHALSICRTWGDGTEWTDVDADGPNIEFDNFGLWLWALGEARAAGGEIPDTLRDAALDGVADVLVWLVDPRTGLLLPDSSIWERHWNGNQQQFTYSSAWAVAGLRAAAALADEAGDARADTYRQAAGVIAAGIATHLVDARGVVAASREQLATGADYLDLAAVEAFNVGALDATGPTFDASLDAWDAGLRVASGNGYARNDDGSVYDAHEWIVMDLRLAEALRRSCRPDAAAALERWVAATARANDDILPELLEPTRGDVAGPAPMLGFGAGAWMLAMHGRDAADAACLAATTDTTGDPDAACGCGTRAPVGLFPALVPAVLTLLRRRPPSRRSA
ncbi:MAG: hypothetical protein RLZZ299_281 [Pseudomonadota bacterium]